MSAPVTLTALLESFTKGDTDTPPMSVYRWWIHQIPKRFHKNAWPVRLQNGLLTFHARHSTWCFELEPRKDKLLRSVRKYAPDAQVNEIRIVVGSMDGMIVK